MFKLLQRLKVEGVTRLSSYKNFLHLEILSLYIHSNVWTVKMVCCLLTLWVCVSEFTGVEPSDTVKFWCDRACSHISDVFTTHHWHDWLISSVLTAVSLHICCQNATLIDFWRLLPLWTGTNAEAHVALLRERVVPKLPQVLGGQIFICVPRHRIVTWWTETHRAEEMSHKERESVFLFWGQTLGLERELSVERMNE